MTTRTFPYSGFLRGPSDVLPALELGDVVLERRDGDDLVLSTHARSAALHEGLGVGASALRSIARLHMDVLKDALAGELPWLRWLPEDDQATCLRELTDDLAASVDTDSFVRFQNDLVAWRNTAQVWADPALAERLQADLAGEAGEVQRPSTR